MSRSKSVLPAFTEASAHFSKCGRYRYGLERAWPRELFSPAERLCVFVMLNPSTADATVLDPTVTRCVGFAQRFGCNRLEVVNLFALCSTDPSALYSAEDPVGDENDHWISEAAILADVLVLAWGHHGAHKDRDVEVFERMRTEPRRRAPLQCLGVTSDGSPRHPLYVRGDTPLMDFLIASRGASR